MEVIAHARHIRMSPKKVRLIAGLIRGMDVDRAAAQLRFYRKDASVPVAKLLQSAVANASHNFKMSPDHLYIKAITVDQGPSMKRWRARAFGRAAEILKKSCHITIILDERVASSATEVGAAVVAPAKEKPKSSKPVSSKPKKVPAKTRSDRNIGQAAAKTKKS